LKLKLKSKMDLPKKSTPKKLLLTVKEVAEMLNVGKSTIYTYASQNILKAVVLPSVRPSKAIKRNKKHIRFRPEEVEAFLQRLG
jgi:predicted DNA-binding transcriptional regulator AlpA